MNEGDLVAGRYRLVRPIGRGAMGTVWAARHELLGRDFALKFASITSYTAPQARERFLREAQTIGKLRHPNVVDVADFGEVSDGRGLYLAMELLEGNSLAQHIERSGPLAPRDALAILAEITRGLDAVHAAGIVHQDIKPENIFLSRGPSGGIVPKLLDFGISKRDFDDLLPNEKPFGTPAYMSPEQALGEPVDYHTDIWSLGVVLYEMLTGRHPFVAPNYQALMTKIAEEPLPPLDPSLPVSVRELVEGCLQKNPEDRFPSAAELCRALEQTSAELDPRASSHLIVEKLRALPSLAPPGAVGETNLDVDTSAADGTRKRALVIGLGAVALVSALVALAARRSPHESTSPDPAPSSAPAARPTSTVTAAPSLLEPGTVGAATAPATSSPTPRSALTTAPSQTSSATAKPAASGSKRPPTSVNDPGF